MDGEADLAGGVADRVGGARLGVEGCWGEVLPGKEGAIEDRFCGAEGVGDRNPGLGFDGVTYLGGREPRGAGVSTFRGSPRTAGAAGVATEDRGVGAAGVAVPGVRTAGGVVTGRDGTDGVTGRGVSPTARPGVELGDRVGTAGRVTPPDGAVRVGAVGTTVRAGATASRRTGADGVSVRRAGVEGTAWPRLGTAVVARRGLEFMGTARSVVVREGAPDTVPGVRVISWLRRSGRYGGGSIATAVLDARVGIDGRYTASWVPSALNRSGRRGTEASTRTSCKRTLGTS